MADRTHLKFLAAVWSVCTLSNMLTGGTPEMSGAFFIVAGMAYIASFFADQSA